MAGDYLFVNVNPELNDMSLVPYEFVLDML